MPSETVGSCGTAEYPNTDLAVAELRIGIAFLQSYVGAPPDGTRLDLVWIEYELGSYPEIGLVWDQGSLDERHWSYINACEAALDELDDAVDWDALSSVGQTEEEDAL